MANNNILTSHEWRGTNHNVQWKRPQHEDTVEMLLTHPNQRPATVRVRRHKAFDAQLRYELEGYTVYCAYLTARKKAGIKEEVEKPVAETGVMGRPTRAVIRLTDGKIFASARLAGEPIGASSQHIHTACCREGSYCKGHQFKYASFQETEYGYKGPLVPAKGGAKTEVQEIEQEIEQDI